MNMRNFYDVKAGDVVKRMLAGSVPMELMVESVDDTLIHCKGGWTFGRETGAEEDEDLQWGKKYGRTGSFLVGYRTP
jgi:hypothetical protein